MAGSSFVMTPEQQARAKIDVLLGNAGWAVQNVSELDLTAGRGIAVREFSLKAGHGSADYLLYVDRKVVGVVEAKKVGDTLTGVEVQTEKYGAGLPDNLPAPRKPLPFLYQSTGIETKFTDARDSDAASRDAFTFHHLGTFADMVGGLIVCAAPVLERGTKPLRLSQQPLAGPLWGSRTPPVTVKGVSFASRTAASLRFQRTRTTTMATLPAALKRTRATIARVNVLSSALPSSLPTDDRRQLFSLLPHRAVVPGGEADWVISEIVSHPTKGFQAPLYPNRHAALIRPLLTDCGNRCDTGERSSQVGRIAASGQSVTHCPTRPHL